MNTDKTSTQKKVRGRPKTLNCEETIDIAMQEYWLDENNDISLNEICKRAKVSKPGIYREFGNEDGLMEAVLQKYENDVTSKLLNILNTQETLTVKKNKVNRKCIKFNKLQSDRSESLIKNIILDIRKIV